MRAADSDRQAVADRLRGALDEGRLDLAEYDERLQRAYAAKTYGELGPLLSDLPSVAPAAQSQVAPAGSAAAGPVAGSAPRSEATRRWLAERWGGYFGVVAICVTIWLLTSVGDDEAGWNGFWPIWVIGPWGLVLLFATAGGLLSGEPERWAARGHRRSRARGHARRYHCG